MRVSALEANFFASGVPSASIETSGLMAPFAASATWFSRSRARCQIAAVAFSLPCVVPLSQILTNGTMPPASLMANSRFAFLLILVASLSSPSASSPNVCLTFDGSSASSTSNSSVSAGGTSSSMPPVVFLSRSTIPPCASSARAAAAGMAYWAVGLPFFNNRTRSTIADFCTSSR